MENDIYSGMQHKKKQLLLELKQAGIENAAILKAMEQVPREAFIPQRDKSYAYMDTALPIGYEQTISSPYIVAYMLQAANLNKKDIVLEIGTGSGYQTAILSLLCNKIFSVEIVPELAESAKQCLEKLGFLAKNNVEIQTGSGYLTKYKKNSFDAIIVTAAPASIPDHLKDLLKIKGRLIIPVGASFQQQKLYRIIKVSDTKFIKEDLLDVRFVPMVK